MSKRDVPSPNENIAPITDMITDGDLTSVAPAKKPRLATQGRVAVSGRVASVRLQNFMCHANLQIDFLTLHNNCFYIGGPNGSGKSALFAAINLGLGGRGSDNDRGSTVKSYIKDGTTQSKICITLTNEGLNAHPDFDQLISIERTINQTSSTYVMKSIKVTSSNNHIERIVSKKKSDIDRIINRFNIHLSNPAFWMSQDRSRSFLANFKPSNVYKLYLESTNLENILQSYVRFASAIEDCYQLVTKKSDETANEQRKLKRMQEQRDLQEKIETDRALVLTYRWKLMFCKVRDYDDEIKVNQQKQVIHKKLHEEIKSGYATNRTGRLTVEKDIQSLCDDIEVQQSELDEVKEVVDEKSKKIYSLEEQKKQLEVQIKRKKQEIKSIKNNVMVAENEMRGMIEKRGNEQLTKKLALVESDHRKISQERERMELGRELNDLRDKLDMASADFKKKDDEKYELQRQINKLRMKIDQDQDVMRRSRATKKDAINKFGPRMAEIFVEINKIKSQFQDPPKGPLGKYITLSEPKWAYAVEECLHNIANNFLCSTQRDADLLRSVFRQLRIPANDQPAVFVRNFNGDPYSNLQEPSSEYKTIYRVLKISDPDINNVVIDKTGCEQFLLIEDKTEAMQIMGSSHPPRNAVRAFTIDASQAYAGGPNSQYRFYAGKPGRATGMFGSEQANVDEAALARGIEEAKAKISQMESHDMRIHEATVKDLQRERYSAKSAIDEFERKLSSLRSQEMKMDRLIADLRAELEQEADEDQVDNLTESIEVMKKKIPGFEAEAEDLENKLEELVDEINPAIKEKREASKMLSDIQTDISELTGRSQKLQKELAKFDDEGDAMKIRLDKLKADEGVLYHDEARLKTERDDAAAAIEKDKLDFQMPDGEQDPPDLTDFPTTQEAEKTLIELGKTIDRSAQGCDTAITFESVKEFKDKLKKRRYFCRMLEDALEKLRQIHDARLKAYPSLKKYTELKVCDKFQELLEVRGHFIGGLEFDHDKETLNVNVQSSKEKDPMSGRKNSAEDEDEEEEDEDEESYDDASDDDDDDGPRRKKAKKQQQKKKKKARDLKGLSGGERSFVTAALVMSLWEVMEQPFRMMDEFDVFMDMMNRKLVMDLLVELATKKFPHNQFIFFTPQGIKELKKVDGLQVFEMNKVRD